MIALRVRDGHRAIMGENKNANGGREIAILPGGIERGDDVRYRGSASGCDILEARPEVVFEADAGLVTAYDDGSLFHC